MSFSVAVAGASGYAGGELLRLLAAIPTSRSRTVTAHRTRASRCRASAAPALARAPHARATRRREPRGARRRLPRAAARQSGELTAQLADDTARHRLRRRPPAHRARPTGPRSTAASTTAPGPTACPSCCSPTAARSASNLVGATRIAAPGCNVTADHPGPRPGHRAGVIEPDDLVAVLAVGPSGAGKSLEDRPARQRDPRLGHPRMPVGGTHRHTPEIQQNLRPRAARASTISFTPVLVPMSRGILATSTAQLVPGVDRGRGPRGLGGGLRRRAVRAPAARRAVPAHGRRARAPTPR